MAAKKIALVLAGGGARGAFQVGVVQSLIEKFKLDFEIIYGTSAGTLNGAFLAQAPMGTDSLKNLGDYAQRLERLWKQEIKGSGSVYEYRGLLSPIPIVNEASAWANAMMFVDSVYDNSRGVDMIRRNLSMEALKNSGRKFKCAQVSLVTGKMMMGGNGAESGEELFQSIVASTTIPVVFPVVQKPNDTIVDGGARDITPLGSVFDEKPDAIYVALTSKLERENGKFPSSGVIAHKPGDWKDHFGNPVTGLDVLARTLDILTDEIQLDDIRNAELWNNAVEVLEKSYSKLGGNTKKMADKILEQRRYVPLNVIAPRAWYNEDVSDPNKKNDALNFSPALIGKYIEHGRAVGADKSRWLIRAKP